MQAINTLGQATGQAEALIGFKAFIWQGGVVTQFLEPAGGGYDINDSSTVVGFGGTGPFAAMWVGGPTRICIPHGLWRAKPWQSTASMKPSAGPGRLVSAIGRFFGATKRRSIWVISAGAPKEEALGHRSSHSQMGRGRI